MTELKLTKLQEEIISRVKGIYEGFPFEEDDELEYEVSDVFKKLNLKQQEKAGAEITNSEVALELKNMDCFTHRAHIKSGAEMTYWNPLEQKFKDFKEDHVNLRIGICQAAQEHPAPDIIYNWAMFHLNR